MAERTEEDKGQRVAALRRFRELLVQQRAKFENYLMVLDHERADIESGDVDKLAAHVEIEEAIVSEIFTFQKVIDPSSRSTARRIRPRERTPSCPSSEAPSTTCGRRCSAGTPRTEPCSSARWRSSVPRSPASATPSPPAPRSLPAKARAAWWT